MVILLIGVLMDSTNGDSSNCPDGECLCINQIMVISQYELCIQLSMHNCYYTVQSKADDKNIALIFCL